jgi:myo-inositol-1(or 4)-monophosphatase
MEELNAAVKAAREAGKVLMDHFRQPHQVKHKTSFRDIVTEADAEADEAIQAILQRKAPGIAIQTEESGGDAQERFWTVDPLDGTLSYAFGLDTFGVSIGLVEKASCTLGVIYLPIQDQLFTAVKGKGAFLNGKPVRVSQRPELQQAFLALRHNDLVRQAEKVMQVLKAGQGMRVAGSTAQDLCYLAAGWLDAVIKSGQYLWDYAAGKVIVEEAGGKLTAWDGKPIGSEHKADILATNGLLHEKAVGLLR